MCSRDQISHIFIINKRSKRHSCSWFHFLFVDIRLYNGRWSVGRNNFLMRANDIIIWFCIETLSHIIFMKNNIQWFILLIMRKTQHHWFRCFYSTSFPPPVVRKPLVSITIGSVASASISLNLLLSNHPLYIVKPIYNNSIIVCMLYAYLTEFQSGRIAFA